MARRDLPQRHAAQVAGSMSIRARDGLVRRLTLSFEVNPKCWGRAHGWSNERVSTIACLFVVMMVCCGTTASALGQDRIEFLSGAAADGKVVEIRKAEREVLFESKIANRVRKRVYPYSKIHAVTYQAKRYVLNPKSDNDLRSVDQIINEVGSTPPDWFGTTPLDYPDTLDLDWPQPAPQPWNNQKNVGQYIWDRINPNPTKWKSGIRFLHHLLSNHKDDQEKSIRVMKALGGMYFRLFQDYARAAYWWRLAGTSPASLDGVGLAECYFRLGDKRMAVQTLNRRQLRVETIKLLGTMGDLREATRMADAYARQAKEPQWALLAAGDACRAAGEYDRAIRYYRSVLASSGMRNEQYQQRAQSRARQSIDAIRQFELLDIAKIKDGDYEAEVMAYEGPLAVKVTVRDGKISDLVISKHKEKQFYSALRDMPAQIIAKQSVKDVDATSRATITAQAIISATAKALVGDVDTSLPGRRERPFR